MIGCGSELGRGVCGGWAVWCGGVEVAELFGSLDTECAGSRQVIVGNFCFKGVSKGEIGEDAGVAPCPVMLFVPYLDAWVSCCSRCCR